MQNTVLFSSSCICVYLCSLFIYLCLSVRKPLEGLSFVKTLATFGIICATDSRLQNLTKIVCFRWLTLYIFNYKPLKTMLNSLRQYFKIRVVSVRLLSLKQTRWFPSFFAFLTQVTQYMIILKSKKNVSTGNFCASGRGRASPFISWLFFFFRSVLIWELVGSTLPHKWGFHSEGKENWDMFQTLWGSYRLKV